MIVSRSEKWAVCLIFFVNLPHLPPSSKDCSHLLPGPSGVSSSVDFHRRRLSTTLTPESLSYMLAMFLFKRTADVQNGPLVWFRMCWSVWGWKGLEDLERKSREGGQEFESKRNVKLSFAQCIILWSKKKLGPPVNSLHWTLFTLFIFLLDKLLHWCFGLLSCFLFFFPSFLSFLKTAMRVVLPPLFLLISSKVINVVYSAELVCIPLVWLCKAILSCVSAFVSYSFSFPSWVYEWMFFR